MKITQLLITLGLMGTALTACTDIDEGERFSGPVSVEAKKNVLIEDFTGQRCINCPNAADAVTTLQQTYGAERVIAVAIHGGSLSYSDSPTSGNGLATEQGNAYHTQWGLQSWPMGLVDRTGGTLDLEKWTDAVVTRFAVTPKVDIAADAVQYDDATRTLSLTTSVTAAEAVTGRLQVWLTESNIVGLQYMPDGSINRQYVHNHVFRASVNDTAGDEMTLQEGETQTKTYTYTLARPYWNAANMAAVIFFYNAADGVMQVIDTKLINQ